MNRLDITHYSSYIPYVMIIIAIHFERCEHQFLAPQSQLPIRLHQLPREMGKEKQLIPPPLLVTSHGEESAKHSFYNMLENRYQTTCIPILSNKSILGSAYGWLALLDRTEGALEGDCCLWNPTSMETIQLPQLLENTCPYNNCVFSKPPTDPDCFIVFNQLSSWEQLVYRIRDHALFKVKTATEKAYRVVAMVSFQGMIYGILQPSHEFLYQFVTIHMVGDTLETRPLLIDAKHPWEVPQPIRSWITLNMNYLIESPCGNELLLVTKMFFNYYLNNGVHFRVFRVDVSRMECEELHNLDDQTIFISYYGNGFCRSSKSFGPKILPNSIYYTNSNGMAMYVYNLDDRSTITLLPYPDADIDPETSESFWVDLPDILNSSGLV